MQPEQLRIPPFLKRGGCIGLFSPAGPVRDQDRLQKGTAILRELGFTVRQSAPARQSHDYLSADDRFRADEFQALIIDEQVDALMAVRGGYGCQRLIPLLDLELVRAHPKLIIGFSDLTVLLNAIAGRARVMTVHGPVVTSLGDCDRESILAFGNLLGGRVHSYPAPGGLEVLRSGTADGTLLGGNLATLVHLLATPWEIDWRGALLFLEDTGEPMYRIDRMLTQLHQCGRLEKLAGLILGTFDLGPDSSENLRLQEQIWHRVLELTDRAGYPVWGGFPAGHRQSNFPLLLGARATMDSGAGELRWQLK
jgi:muramoyltetrapeptide carboxypeptidase